MLSALILNACSFLENKRPFVPPVYPPPPESPRFVFEATVRSSNDITRRTFGDKLREFATGVRVDPAGLSKPYGIAVKKGRIYVTDTQQRAITLFDLNTRQFKIFGVSGGGSVQKPLGIDVSIDDEVYVADVTSRRIFVYDLDGNFKRLFGNDLLLERPVGVSVANDGKRVYVVDTGGNENDHHRVQVFDATSGAHLFTIGRRGTELGEFNMPLHSAVAPDNTVYVVDGGNFRIQSFDADGKIKGTFGSIGRRSGQFSRPKGIAIDKDGNIYVVDTAFGNFQIFSPSGELLLFIGARATSGGPGFFSLPSDIAVDEDGRIYVVDQFFRKVDIFRPANVAPLPVFADKEAD